MLTDYDNFKLKSVKKGYVYDQDKVFSPKETYDKTFGILSKAYPEKEFVLKNISSTPGLFVYTFGDGVMLSTGKGATEQQAKTSAIMEFVERFSVSHFDYNNAAGYEWNSFENMKRREGLEAYDVNFRISYSLKKDWFYNRIVKVPLLWINGFNLTRGRKTYYPLNWTNMYQSSNGLASGNSVEETILQALCEVIERHNMDFFIKNFETNKLKLINPETIRSEVILNLIETLRKNKIEIYIFDATLDVGVNTIIACGVDKRKNDYDYGYVGYGYGCQASPEKAIIRAITEYVQLNEQTYYNNSKFFKDINPKYNWQFTLNLNVLDKLGEAKIVSFDELDDLSDVDFKVELENVVERLRNHGHEVVAVEKTHPKLSIPVFRVFVPGFLPGTKFASTNENDDLLLVEILYQAGLVEEAKKYYNDNFKRIIFDNSEVYLEVFFNHFPTLTREMLEEHLTPEVQPIDAIIKPTYIEQLRHNIKFFGPKK